MREKHIHLRLTDTEYRQLAFLAAKEKRKPCGMLRYLITAIAKQNGYSDSTGPEFAPRERVRHRVALTFTEEEWTWLEWQRIAHSFNGASSYILSVIRQELTGASLMPAIEVLEFQKCRSSLNSIGLNVN